MPPIDFSHIFHQSSKDHAKGHPPIVPDSRLWPKEWLTTYYKTYPRFKKVILEDGSVSADFFDALRKRRSARNFSSDPISVGQLSILLKYSCGIVSAPGAERITRAHPSGGGRYPLEVYPLVLRGAPGLPPGLYHYDVSVHQLDVLWERSFPSEAANELFSYEWVKGAAVVFIITGIFYRTQMKYGERGYRYVLLEAGHMGQNLLLTAQVLNLKGCALVGTRDKEIEHLLDIDGSTESLVYALALGT